MREQFQNVSVLINSIDFESIWKGFHQFDFALYNKTTVWLKTCDIPRNSSFVGNTAIDYKGQLLAIWDMNTEGSANSSLLAANLVHEMFHAYQYEHCESRFPQDLQTLDYPRSTKNFEAKLAENRLLVSAYNTTDIEQKRELLKKLLRVRNYRIKLIGDAIKNEFLTETSEGLAEYVGLLALKQLSVPDFVSKTHEYCRVLSSMSSILLDVRKVSYYSGALLLLTLLDADVSIEHTIGECRFTVHELVKKALGVLNDEEMAGLTTEENARLLAMANEYYDNIEKQVAGFMAAKQRTQHAGEFFITAYDPMNMVKTDNRILCKTFVTLKNVATREELQLTGPVLIELDSNSVSKVVAYYS